MATLQVIGDGIFPINFMLPEKSQKRFIIFIPSSLQFDSKFTKFFLSKVILNQIRF